MQLTEHSTIVHCLYLQENSKPIIPYYLYLQECSLLNILQLYIVCIYRNIHWLDVQMLQHSKTFSSVASASCQSIASWNWMGLRFSSHHWKGQGQFALFNYTLCCWTVRTPLYPPVQAVPPYSLTTTLFFLSCPGQRNRRRPVPVLMTGVHYNSLL